MLIHVVVDMYYNLNYATLSFNVLFRFRTQLLGLHILLILSNACEENGNYTRLIYTIRIKYSTNELISIIIGLQAVTSFNIAR